LSPHQASEASEARLSMGGARVRADHAHSVNVGHWSASDPGEAAAVRELAASFDRSPRLMRVVGREALAGSSVASPARAGADRSLRGVVKRVFDIVGAVLLGLVFSPLMVVIAVLLWSEGAPVFYRHRRIGRGGSTFECNNTDYRRRVALDVYYVRKQSLLLDLYILFKTPRVVLGGGGAY
jgi:hypothetical protein